MTGLCKILLGSYLGPAEDTAEGKSFLCHRHLDGPDKALAAHHLCVSLKTFSTLNARDTLEAFSTISAKVT